MRNGVAKPLSILLLSVLVIIFSLLIASKGINSQPRAATICEVEGGKCCPSTYGCSGNTSGLSCETGTKCCFGNCIPPASPTPKPCNGTCIPNGEKDTCKTAGSGVCPLYKYCCAVFKPDPSPKPSPEPGEDCQFLYNGKCVDNKLVCKPSDVILADCPSGKKCVPESAQCTNPTPTITPTPQPDTICAVEGGYCYPNDWYCIGGTKSALTCKTGEKCYFGGSCSGPETGYCPLSEGLTWCTQTNPLWANNPFPKCESSSVNKWYKRACGFASTSSILCNYIDTSYCDLRHTMASFREYAEANCIGSSMWLHQDVLENFPSKLDVQNIGSIIPIPWKKINENLKYGPLMVGGKFRIRGKTGWINHISVITKKDSRGYVFHDPYFNSDNPNAYMRVNSVYLREYMDIQLDSAVSVRPI